MKKILLSSSLLISISIYAQHGVSTNWSPEYVLSKTSPTKDASKGGTGQNIIRLSNGDIVQCFVETPGMAKIYLVKSTTDGTTWNTPVNYSPTLMTNVVSGPTIAKDTADNIHMVWIRNVPDKAMYYSKMDKDFNVLIDTIRIDNPTIVYNHAAPYITVDRKMRVHVLWHVGDVDLASTSTEFAKVSYVSSNDNGLTWGLQKIISDTTSHKHAAFPRANFSGVNSDTLAFPWRQEVVSTTAWDVWIAYSTDGGATWTRTLAAGTANSEWDPGVVVDKNNRIHLHYHEYQGTSFSNPKIEYAYSDDLGTTWSPANPFSSISPTSIRSQLSVFAYDFETNLQCICWKDERDFVSPIDGNADVMCSFSSDGGISWQGQEFVTDIDTTELIFKSIEVGSNGILYSTYEFDDINGKRSIYLRKRNAIVSINELNNTNSSVTVYPNPTNGDVRIILQNQNLISTKIYNSIGELIREIYTSEFSISDLPNGLYFLQIQSNNSTHTSKIIKNNP